MVEQIEDSLLSGHCKIINNWDQTKCPFCDAAATICAHGISKMITQTKKAIQNEVNILLLGSSNNKKAIGEQETLGALMLCEHEDKKTSE